MSLLIRFQIYRNLMVLGKNKFKENHCLKEGKTKIKQTEFKVILYLC